MRDIITEIWSTARRNKLRTTLTGFAVAWGIFMIIVLLGAGNGLINATMKQHSDFFTNSMEAYGGMTSKAYNGLSEGRYIRLNERDLTTTDSEFKATIDEVGACYYTSATVTNGENYMSMQINGVYPIHSKIVKQELLYGRFINEIDQKEKRKVVVLSNKHAKELLGNEKYETFVPLLPGETLIGALTIDINNDGYITPTDAAAIRRHISNPDSYPNLAVFNGMSDLDMAQQFDI